MLATPAMSPLESVIVLPQLSDSSAASSSAFCSTRSASLKSRLPRSAASIVLQGPDSSACRAALTALSTSASSSRRNLGDHLAGRGVVRLELTAIDRVDPLVVNEELGQPNLGAGRGRRNFRGHGCSSPGGSDCSRSKHDGVPSASRCQVTALPRLDASPRIGPPTGRQ